MQAAFKLLLREACENWLRPYGSNVRQFGYDIGDLYVTSSALQSPVLGMRDSWNLDYQFWIYLVLPRSAQSTR